MNQSFFFSFLAILWNNDGGQGSRVQGGDSGDDGGGGGIVKVVVEW